MNTYQKTTIIGHVGQNPEITTFQNGGKIAKLSVATSQTWKDQKTGERKEKTEWHRVIVKREATVKFVEQYVKKGALVHVEGLLETRKYAKDGQDHYVTEVIVFGFETRLDLLASKAQEEPAPEPEAQEEGE